MEEESTTNKTSLFSQFKHKLHVTTANPQKSSECDSNEGSTLNELSILKQAYFSLLYAVLDPMAHLTEPHNFQLRSFTKLTSCDECDSVLWGIHKQGLQCSKCFMCIHEKCQELIKSDCSQQQKTKLNNNQNVFKRLNSSASIQTELENRLNDIENTYKTYFLKLKHVFKILNLSLENDMKLVHQDYLNKNVRLIKSKIKILVKSASNLIAKDARGTSDPYVTIQCGCSKIKRTKTNKKTLNPVWNETVEFEYFNTADGICSESGNSAGKIIIRLWDEDVGLKAKLDKMLTNESDDFLGQIVLDVNDLNFDCEQIYQLKPRSDNEHITGSVVLNISSIVLEISSCSDKELKKEAKRDSKKGNKYSNFQQYKTLHRHLFSYVIEHEEKKMLACVPDETVKLYKVEYFKEKDLNLFLKHFSNKYAIDENQKQIIHLELFYTNFIDNCIQNLNETSLIRNESEISCDLIEYVHGLFSSVCDNIASRKIFENDKEFLMETFFLPNKLILLLSNYRFVFPADLTKMRSNKSMEKVLNFFKSVCSFLSSNNSKIFIKALDLKTKRSQLELKYPNINRIEFEGFSSAYESLAIKRAIECGLISYFDTEFLNLANTYESEQSSRTSSIGTLKYSDDGSSTEIDSNSLCLSSLFLTAQVIVKKIEILNQILCEKIYQEIELNEKFYYEPLSHFFSGQSEFKNLCIRVLVKKVLIELVNTVKNDQDILLILKPEHIKLHLNFYLLIQKLLSENELEMEPLNDLINFTFFDHHRKLHFDTSLNEIFQPFLLKFLGQQEDQFIKYIHRIHDTDKISSLAEEISASFSNNHAMPSTNFASCDPKTAKDIKDLENYYSPSVTDLFTILHELLRTVLLFDSSNSELNMSHHLCFANLVKSKLLIYTSHVKKEYHRICKSNRDRNVSNHFTITSCIFINNFKKTIELLEDIELKLSSKSNIKQTVIDQFESIKLILKEELYGMILDYSIEYYKPLTRACEVIQVELYGMKKSRKMSFLNQMNMLIDQTLYNLLNEKFMICKIILFDSLFKSFLEEIFKISIKSFEESIILKKNLKYNSEIIDIEASIEIEMHMFSFKKFAKFFSQLNSDDLPSTESGEMGLLNEFQYKIVESSLRHVVDFFSADEECLKCDYLINTVEFSNATKTLNMYLNTPNQLMSNFIKGQNLQQNNIDFSVSHGKIRLQVEIRQSLECKNEFNFKIKALELRHSKPSFDYDGVIGHFKPCVEFYLFGPYLENKWKKMLIKNFYLDKKKQTFYFNQNCFEFKLKLSNEEAREFRNKDFLSNYEIQIIVKDLNCPKQFRIIGLCVFNLNQAVQSVDVWNRFKREEKNHGELIKNTMFGSMELWLSLNSRLKINDDGSKILKVLDRYVYDRRPIEFIQLKLASRYCSNWIF